MATSQRRREDDGAAKRPEAVLDAAARLRLERDRALTMSQRLERMQALCLQMTAISGTARHQ